MDWCDAIGRRDSSRPLEVMTSEFVYVFGEIMFSSSTTIYCLPVEILTEISYFV